MEASRSDRCPRGPGMDSGRHSPASGRRMGHALHALLPFACAVLATLPHSASGIVPWPGLGLAVIVGTPRPPRPPWPPPPPPGGCDAAWEGCDDGDPCTQDLCINNSCRHTPLSGPSCTDDGNPCTVDVCLNGACTHPAGNDGATCLDDGDECTDDVCFDGACIHPWLHGPPCPDDGDPCTIDMCIWGACAHLPGNDGAACLDDDNECTDDVCFGGTCTHPGLSGPPCTNDGDPCTDDVCVNGGCTHPPTSGPPCEPDGDPCTDDVCDNGACTHPAGNDGAGCADDGNSCTDDICDNGACTHPAANDGSSCAGDGNPCTEDICDNGACISTPRDDGYGCYDGNSCTENDTCQGGTCVGTQFRDCDDGDICTDDECVGQGCTNPFNSAPCSDSDLCTTNDTCQNGFCSGTPVDCSTTDPCITGWNCDPSTGCVYEQLDCDDGDPCTDDWCNSVDGICYHAPTSEGAECLDDGDPCTPDRCVEGECVHTWPEYCDWLLPPVDPDRACTTYGCSMNLSLSEWIPLNNDDDNDNGVPDYQDTGAIAGEDELDWVSWATPGCPPATGCTTCGHSGEDHWHPESVPETLVMFSSLDRDQLVFDSLEPWPPPSGFYIEGRLSSSDPCGEPWRFSLWYNEPPGYYCESVSDPIAVVKVSSLEWEKADPDNLDLGTCDNNGGKRILPGKLDPEDLFADDRRKVSLVATIAPPIEDVDVYFQVWDVDDPFDQVHGPLGADDIPNVDLIDDDTDGPDNRGSGSIVGVHGPFLTDGCGRAILTMTVSMQPGDNYRAAASVIDDVFHQTNGQVNQADADAKQYDHSGNWSAYEVPAVWSKMLTVWRRLHVETDSMARPTFAQNTYSTDWTNPTQGETPDRVELQIRDSVFGFATANGQFDEGWIQLSGNAGVVNGRVFEFQSSFGWDEVIVIVSAANGLGGQQGLAGLGGMSGGAAVLSDDDLSQEATFGAGTWGCDSGFALGSVLEPPDLDALELRYAPAYILPVHDAGASGTGGITTFLQNVDFGGTGYGKVLWDQAKAPTVRQLPISTTDNWTVMVVNAWQAETDQDGDPNSESLTNGISTHGSGGTTTAIWQLGSAYTGICAVFKALMIGEADIPERYTVAHEIAHTLGLPHSATGLMFPAESVGAPAQQSDPFAADSLQKLREYNGP